MTPLQLPYQMLFAGQVADAWADNTFSLLDSLWDFLPTQHLWVLYSGGGGEERMVQLLQVKNEEKQFVQMAIPN